MLTPLFLRDSSVAATFEYVSLVDSNTHPKTDGVHVLVKSCVNLKQITYKFVCQYLSKGALRTAGTFVFDALPTERIKWSEGVFPQQQWQGRVQRDYRESFMKDLITPFLLLSEIFSPKGHRGMTATKNLFTVALFKSCLNTKII